ncbi:hypothetical protein L6452_18725 [Arctium lappa]|uniref:Uncharacterized protein n=1 Tax=Arctium lappa TaxID=4217 RepID=A0ACB9C6X9_ARCLA|nr:hypothetical protein L6452_18725 [Arctium lappa]
MKEEFKESNHGGGGRNLEASERERRRNRVENQIWKDLAQTNEATANALHNNLCNDDCERCTIDVVKEVVGHALSWFLTLIKTRRNVFSHSFSSDLIKDSIHLKFIHRSVYHLKHQAINACLTPLYSVEGMHVITVEGLGNQRFGLHPVHVEPETFKAIENIKGDGGVGTIQQTTFVDGGEWMDNLESATMHAKFVPSAANEGSTYKVSSIYKCKDPVKFTQENAKFADEYTKKTFKAIEAYIIANPNAY